MATDVKPRVTDAGDEPLQIGPHLLHSRLIVGTGKYDSFELMRDSLDVSGVECITVVEHMTFNVGNAMKYCWRAGLKTVLSSKHIEDLKKARWYLDREIERLEKSTEEASP